MRKLEQVGRVQLPPMVPRKPGARPRGLFDDGQPLPALPKLPTQGPIPGLLVRLIEDEHDPTHRIWKPSFIQTESAQVLRVLWAARGEAVRAATRASNRLNKGVDPANE